jgi:acetyl-CoA carboxylase carboxyltransferase component
MDDHATSTPTEGPPPTAALADASSHAVRAPSPSPPSSSSSSSAAETPTSLLRPLVEDLEARRAKAMLGGGEEKIAKQHEREKLTARERIALLIDAGTFVELGIHGRPHSAQRAMDGVEAPADGVVTGYGKIDGRLAAVCAYDFTVMAGSMGMTGEIKVTRLRELALTKRIPFVWLLDSAGARVQEAAGAMFAGSGHLFREEVVMSGVIPQVAALMGPCAAGTAYIPGLADFVPMVRGRGSMALAGPHLVRAAVGEDVTQEELGGSRVHCRKSGVGDMEVADDEECIARIKEYLSYMPSNCEQRPPVRAGGAGGTGGAEPDPIERAEEALLDVLPESNRKPYDMYEVIKLIVDDGEYLDIKRQWAKTIITCFARFGGRPVGIVANQPKQLGGILDNDSSDKAARFVNLCNAFAIPLVFIQDVPGFMVGTKVEAEGIIRHGAKMLYAVANATVPKITVITRKAYGAGYYVMNGRAYEPDLIVAWPSAEISVMGAEGVVEIAFRKVVEEAEDPAAKRAELIEGFRKQFDVYIAAGNDLIDDVIDPRETRLTICRALEVSANKKVERPWKRHGVVPV